MTQAERQGDARLSGAAPGIVMLAALCVAWLATYLDYDAHVKSTGYTDLLPEVIAAGIAMAAWAGATAWFVAPRGGRPRRGALAGGAMFGTYVAGQLLLAITNASALAHGGALGGGETWFSFLLESWFWIGIPLVGCGLLGLAGWLVVAAVARVADGAAGRNGRAQTGRST